SASGSWRKNGDRIAIGWTAEQRSCRKPGRVSAAERVPPPISSRASSTSTEQPARASWTAAARPLGPAPTTTASDALISPPGSRPASCRPGLALPHRAHVERVGVEQAGGGIVDPVRHRGAPERLALDEDAAQLAGREAALLLHRAQQRLAVEMAVAEVPAQH